MALVVPDVHGEIRMLEYIMGISASGNKILKLFSNDLTPSDTTVVGVLTEVSAAGYAVYTMLNSSAGWTISQSGGTTTALHSAVTFTFTTTAQVYGYYVTNTTGELLWLERFTPGAPFLLPASGGSITISPRASLT